MKRALVSAGLVLSAGCGVTPLTNKIDVGDDPFVIAVGEGPDSLTDLFAAPAGGGRFVRLTFNRAEERAPRLAPDGKHVAYLRGAESWALVMLDLTTNGERTAPVPAEAGEPMRLGWSADGGRVTLRAASGYFSTGVAELRLMPVAPAARAEADSVTRERLGPFSDGLVGQCGEAAGLCVTVRDSVTPLGSAVTGAIRWGDDSVGYFRAGAFEVRPLGGGRTRKPIWDGAPARLRELTYHPGQVTTRTGVSGRR
jgi:hypothetical protein